jgi:ribosome maturation factor RimP
MRAVAPIEVRVLDLIEPAAADLGYEIVRVRLRGAKRKTIEIRAERASDGQMSATDCEVLSRAISPILEVDDPLHDPWTLEVSSPGIDRPLTREKDFARWAGFEVKIELDRMIEGRKRFTGVIAGFADGHAEIDLKGEDDTAMIPFDWIHEARLILTDALIEASLKARRPGDDIAEGMSEDDVKKGEG